MIVKSYLTKLLNLIVIAGLLSLTDVPLLNYKNINQAQAQQIPKPQADRLRELAMQYYNKNQLQQALLTLQKELRLRRQMGDIQQEISALNFIGIIYEQQSKYPQSMESLQLLQNFKNQISLMT